MAKTSSQTTEPEESISGYFRPILLENQELLKKRSNEELYTRWLADHPGYEEVPDRVKLNLSNIKSVLREQLNIRPRKKGKKSAKRAAAAAVAVVVAPVKAIRPPLGELESLEERIDDCLALAKAVDREALEAVIGLLREARNEVIRKQEL